VNQVADGGGSAGTLIDRLGPLFTEIVDLIGQLAGNEAAVRVLDAQQDEPYRDGWTKEPGYFTVPGPRGFPTQALYVAMHPTHPDFGHSPVTNADRERLVQEAVDTVWHQQRDSWRHSAVDLVYRAATRNVWEPDPRAMAAAVDQLQSVTVWLGDQLAPGAGWTGPGSPGSPGSPGWLRHLQEGWPATSQSSSTFYEFWDDVNDKCGLYLHAMARLASTSAEVAGAIHDFQSNLLEVAEKARDHAAQALEQWQVWQDASGAWPSGAVQDTGQFKSILSGVSTVTGLVALFPPAAVVSGGISLATDLGGYLVPEKSIVMEIRTAVESGALHDAFLDDLRTVETNLATALDGLQSTPPADGGTTGDQGFAALAADVVANRRDWRPLEVEL
jgi:hypothetical protein